MNKQKSICKLEKSSLICSITIHAASFDEVTISCLRYAQDLTELPTELKKADFSKEYQEALADNRQDVINQWLPGDEIAYPQFSHGFATKFDE